jgi:2-C-methyl-D-erythritol 4-phosphate cytidylyltransferase / 2-C-methyl-D-erythritol 2,4-cyclodiphosphate synthase
MLAVIVLCPESPPRGFGLPAKELMSSFLGAPLMTRAIAACLPEDEGVTVVVVVPQELAERVKPEACDLFALDEVDAVVVASGGRVACLQAALRALPEDVDVVVVSDGSRLMVPPQLVDRLVAAARSGGAAAPAAEVPARLVAEESGSLVSLDSRARMRVLQGPQAFQVTALKQAMSHANDDTDIAEWLAADGQNVVMVGGDIDNFLLCSADDVSRAQEVFARRAIDYAFVYPKNLLPDDPLQQALDAAAAAARLKSS